MKKSYLLYVCVSQMFVLHGMEPRSADYEHSENLELHTSHGDDTHNEKISHLEARIRNLESAIERHTIKTKAQIRAMARDSYRTDNADELETMRQQSQRWLDEKNAELIELKRQLTTLQNTP